VKGTSARLLAPFAPQYGRQIDRERRRKYD